MIDEDCMAKEALVAQLTAVSMHVYYIYSNTYVTTVNS